MTGRGEGAGAIAGEDADVHGGGVADHDIELLSPSRSVTNTPHTPLPVFWLVGFANVPLPLPLHTETFPVDEFAVTRSSFESPFRSASARSDTLPATERIAAG